MNLSHAAPSRRPDALEYRALMALGFGVFLVVELVSRLLPVRRGARRSIVEEARAAARRTVPLAFMG